MDGKTRLAATVIIWSAVVAIFGIIGGVLGTADEVSTLASILIFFVILTLLAVSGDVTKTIWASALSQNEAARQAAKAKRGTRERFSRLAESLDDEEVYELEALLDREHASVRRSHH